MADGDKERVEAGIKGGGGAGGVKNVVSDGGRFEVGPKEEVERRTTKTSGLKTASASCRKNEKHDGPVRVTSRASAPLFNQPITPMEIIDIVRGSYANIKLFRARDAEHSKGGIICWVKSDVSFPNSLLSSQPNVHWSSRCSPARRLSALDRRFCRSPFDEADLNARLRYRVKGIGR